ncbi:MAG: ABC transporter permease [Chitinivibrionales bacterium]|nr:ABC transporter permease [Chitinivibrionales bacterium]
MENKAVPASKIESSKDLKVLQQYIEAEKGATLWKDAIIRLSKNKMAVFGFFVVFFLTTVAIITPVITPYSYEKTNLELGPKPPSSQHWFGTDVLGRDLLARTMYGVRISLTVAIVATLVSLIIGVLWGTIAGFIGGRLDAFMMRIVDILFALPLIILVIILMVVFGRSFVLIFLVIGCVQWLVMARVVRGQVLSIRKQEFIEAAVALGISKHMIMLRHVIPNIFGVVIVYTTLTIPQVMLLEAFLSFLGLGIQPPLSSLGVLINYGAQTMEEYPWLLIFPGFVFSLTLFCLNFLGDGLRDALDPKASKD